MTACEIQGCEKPVLRRGWCSMHYQRWVRHGDPNTGARGSGLNYTSIHRAVRSARGAARDQSCAHCGGRATQWSYNHLDPNEIRVPWEGRQVTVSTDPAFYDPLCSSCHRVRDLRGCCPNGHPYTEENTRIYRGGRKCRTCRRQVVRRAKEKL